MAAGRQCDRDNAACGGAAPQGSWKARGPSADDAMHQLRFGNGNAAVSVNVHKGNTIVSDSCSQGSCNLRCGPTRPGNGWLALGMET